MMTQAIAIFALFGLLATTTTDPKNDDKHELAPSMRGVSSDFEWIKSIEINNNKEKTGNNGGYLQSDSEFVLFTRLNNLVSLTPGYAKSKTQTAWKIWVDLNQDGVFSDDEEVFSANGYGNLNSYFLLPPSAKSGETYMRVAMRSKRYPTLGNDFPYGEVEDYLVEIK